MPGSGSGRPGLGTMGRCGSRTARTCPWLAVWFPRRIALCSPSLLPSSANRSRQTHLPASLGRVFPYTGTAFFLPASPSKPRILSLCQFPLSLLPLRFSPGSRHQDGGSAPGPRNSNSVSRRCRLFGGLSYTLQKGPRILQASSQGTRAYGELVPGACRDYPESRAKRRKFPGCRWENLLLPKPRKFQSSSKARLLRVPVLLPVPGFSGSPEPSSDPKDQKPEPGDAIGAARPERVSSECELSASCPLLGPSARACVSVARGGHRAVEDGCHTGTGSVRVCVRACMCGVRAWRRGNALKTGG